MVSDAAAPRNSGTRPVLMNRYVAWRVGAAIAVVVTSLLFALLWDPTTCMSPAIGCPAQRPDCVIPVYCTHQYVLLRVVIAVVGVLIGLMSLWSARNEGRVHDRADRDW